MAKFELPVCNETGTKIEKVHKREFMPVGLYLKFQKLNERLVNDEIKDDFEMFEELKPLMLETFPELTSEEYDSRVDVAKVIYMLNEIVSKATSIESGNSKNA